MEFGPNAKIPRFPWSPRQEAAALRAATARHHTPAALRAQAEREAAIMAGLSSRAAPPPSEPPASTGR